MDHRSRCVHIHNWSCRGRVQVFGDIQFTRVAIVRVSGEFFENFDAFTNDHPVSKQILPILSTDFLRKSDICWFYFNLRQ